MPIQIEQNGFNNLCEKVKISVFKWVFVPINVGQQHWILMTVYMPEKKVQIQKNKNKTSTRADIPTD